MAAACEMLTHSQHDFAMLYVGKKQPDKLPVALEKTASELTERGKLLEVGAADFGVLFRQIDAFVVHGGLGTTVEALRMKKPVAVTGILLFDQRFWGFVCAEKGVGPMPVHVEKFKAIATAWVDAALDPSSDHCAKAATLEFGDEAEDGVSANVAEFARLIEQVEHGHLLPPKPSKHHPTGQGLVNAAAQLSQISMLTGQASTTRA